MSTATTYPPAKLSGLLASEATRLWHRRTVRLLFLTVFLIYVLIIVIAFFNHNKNGLNHPAFPLDASGDGAVAVGVGVAILMFVVGTTYAGAEWSQRTIVALLFWEPRRMRVMSAKVVVLGLACFVVTVLTQILWLATAYLLASTRGDTTLSSGFWTDLFNREARVLIFTLLVGWLGFGIANLVRFSAASLGVGFVYFAIVEFVVANWWHWAQQWLLLVNAVALLTRGGVDLGDSSGPNPGKHISSLHGVLVWGVVSIGILVIGSVVFARRDAS